MLTIYEETKEIWKMYVLGLSPSIWYINLENWFRSHWERCFNCIRNMYLDYHFGGAVLHLIKSFIRSTVHEENVQILYEALAFFLFLYMVKILTTIAPLKLTLVSIMSIYNETSFVGSQMISLCSRSESSNFGCWVPVSVRGINSARNDRSLINGPRTRVGRCNY